MELDKTKVFISWSGQLAKQVARVWHDLLDAVFDNVDPFMSEKDIEAGDRNLRKIADELSGTNFGIVVVTQDNQNSRWLNYEAGALSKNVKDEESEETGRVVPSIVDFAREGDVERPLGQFQGKLLNQDGIRDTLIALAKVADADKDRIIERFDSLWSTAYEGRFTQAQQVPDTATPKERDTPDKVDEILTIVRSAPDGDTVADILAIVRDMSRTAKFGPPPMQRGLRLAMDSPVDEIRAVASRFLGDDHDIPITLSCDEECRLVVEVHLLGADKSVGQQMFKLGEALMEIEGVHSARFPFDGELHMPPAYKEWAEARKRELQAKRRESGISTEGD
jgi:hypothetical protein